MGVGKSQKSSGLAASRGAVVPRSPALRFQSAGSRPGLAPPPRGAPEAEAPPAWREAGSAGPDGRHTMEATAGPAQPRRGEHPVRRGRWKVPELACPVGEGRGTWTLEFVGLRRVPHILGNPTSVVPPTPRVERAPIWAAPLSPARPHFHHTHPWTPFSRLPSRSRNVRLPLAFPLGAALRRRETRNLGRYHRARLRG